MYNLFSYFRGTDQTADVPNNNSPQSGNKPSAPPQRLESQYRGICQLANGRADVDFATGAKNPQVFLNNRSNAEWVHLENYETLLTGKFTIISNNNESNAIVDWLVIADRSLHTTRKPIVLGEPEIKIQVTEETEPKMKKPVITEAQKNLLQEMLRKVNTKTIEHKVTIDEPKTKKKEKTEFQKELKKKRNVIMRKISIKEKEYIQEETTQEEKEVQPEEKEIQPEEKEEEKSLIEEDTSVQEEPIQEEKKKRKNKTLNISMNRRKIRTKENK